VILLLCWIFALIALVALAGSLAWLWGLLLRLEMWIILKYGKVDEL